MRSIGTALGLALQQPYNSQDNMGNCGQVQVALNPRSAKGPAQEVGTDISAWTPTP